MMSRLLPAVLAFAFSAAHAGVLDTLPAGKWYAFPNSQMQQVAPAGVSVAPIIAAWGSAIYDSDRDQLVVWGGGHNDYSGNEVYAFGPISPGTPTWRRLTNPSSPPAVNTQYASDGRPVSRHTYNLLTYLPAPANKMFSCGIGSQHSNGYSNVGVDLYDFTVDGFTGNPWTRGANPPSTQFALQAFCIFNPATNTVWFHDAGNNNSRLQEYNPATNTWKSHAQLNKDEDYTAAIDPTRNLLVATGHNGGVRVWDLSRPEDPSFLATTSGPKNVEGTKAPGFVFDSANRVFVGWGGAATIYTLAVPGNPRTGTWTWSAIPLDSTNTVVPTQQAGVIYAGYVTGTYGRFRYVPAVQGVVLVNATNENVFFFKLPGSGAAQPTLTLSADPTNVAAQGASTLEWSSTNASSCTASGAWSGSKALAGSQAVGPLTQTSTFTLTCTAAGGVSVNRSATVTVVPPAPAATVELMANPATVMLGSATQLTWSSIDATACTASGGWSGNKALMGSQTVGAIMQQTTFTLTCTGAGPSGSQSVVVNIASPPPPPVLNFNASASSIVSGSTATLTWNAMNVTACTAIGGWSGGRQSSGSEVVGPLITNTSFTLTCANAGVSDTRTIDIAVTSPPITSPTTSQRRGGGGAADIGLLAALLLLAALRRYLRRVAGITAAIACCASVHAADVTTVRVTSVSGSAQSNVATTFALPLKVGDVPAGSSLRARLANGTEVPLQLDVKAAHTSGGSLRHAVLTARLPSLAANATETLTLSTGSALAGTAVALNDLLATAYDTSVTVGIAGTAYSANARNALSASPTTWLSGPLVSEWIASAPLRTAAGATHANLRAYFHVRAHAGTPITQVRTDVVIENTWALVAGGGTFTYNATIAVPGQPDYVKNNLPHYRGTRWHRRVWWGGIPSVYARLDKDYLQDSRAIPKYENVAPSDAYLNSLRSATEPMDNGDQTDNMDDTGYQDGIGPLPRWDAVYAVSTDRRAYAAMLANADGGAAYSTHLRDESTGYPISIDQFPNTSLADPSASNPRLPSNGTSPFFEGQWSSHQPSIGYVAYLVTGDYFYLEEAQFWSAYNLIWPNHVGRNHTSGWWYTGSLRGQAWAYRSLAQAAYITPDAHPLKRSWLDKLASNLQRDRELYVSPGGPHRNNLGAMLAYEGNDEYRFFDYFMSWTVQYLVDLGFADAVPFRDYKVKFPIGLMGQGNNEYCFQAASLYTWKAGPPGTAVFYPDFRTMFENTVPGVAGVACGTTAMTTLLRGLYGNSIVGNSANAMVGDQTSTTYYFANLQPALAAAADSGVPGGQLAWQRAQASGLHPDYRDNPTWAVVPRGSGASQPRVSVNLTANPTSVTVGSTTTLTWTGSNADTCVASGSWAGNKATQGTEVSAALRSNASFTLTCSSNALGIESSTVAVTTVPAPVVPTPVVTLTASPTSVAQNGTSQLAWSATNAGSCVASGQWNGTKSASGNEMTGALTATATFALTCTGAGGDASSSVTVTVAAAPAPTPTPTPAPASGSRSGGGGSFDFVALVLLFGIARLRTAYSAARTKS